MKVKTSELTGAALDWAVERAKGTFWSSNGYFCFENPKRFDHNPEWRYSIDWSQGGPIIESEKIAIMYWTGRREWAAKPDSKKGNEPNHFGLTPLIAAMRCFVATKLGEEVEIPQELIK